MDEKNRNHARTGHRLDLAAFAVLLILAVITVIASGLPLGAAGPVVGLGIAVIKAMIIASVFMELRSRPGVTRLFAIAGVLWLLILISLTLSDYLTRI